MAYDNVAPSMYSFGNFDFGAGSDETFVVQGPKGKAGRLWDYGVQGCIEVMNGSSTTPKIAIGTSSDPDAYGDELDLNALADNSGKSVRSTYREESSGFTTQMVDREIPADTAIYVTCTGAAGSPTGQAVPFVQIQWQR